MSVSRSPRPATPWLRALATASSAIVRARGESPAIPRRAGSKAACAIPAPTAGVAALETAATVPATEAAASETADITAGVAIAVPERVGSITVFATGVEAPEAAGTIRARFPGKLPGAAAPGAGRSPAPASRGRVTRVETRSSLLPGPLPTTRTPTTAGAERLSCFTRKIVPLDGSVFKRLATCEPCRQPAPQL